MVDVWTRPLELVQDGDLLGFIKQVLGLRNNASIWVEVKGMLLMFELVR